MNNLYISGDFVVTQLITDEAEIERFEQNKKAFIKDWKDGIRSRMRSSTNLTVVGPVSVHTDLSKEILTEEGNA